MPPLVPLPKATFVLSSHRTPITTLLFPVLVSTASASQHRYASILSSLSDVPGAYNKRIRRGRGPSSGKGKTSGRGHKGQKQHGKVPRGFNGGQTPDEIVAGPRGEVNRFSVDMSPVNLDRIQSWIDQGRLDISKPITIKELNESRCLHGIKDGVKLLARNADQLRSPIHITVSRASSTAISAVEAAGGTVQTRYYTPSSIKRILNGLTHPTQSLLSLPAVASAPSSPYAAHAHAAAAASTSTDGPSSRLGLGFPQSMKAFRYRLPDPAGRKDLEYYRDPAHRGYLSYQLQGGQSPSLFFKKPGQVWEEPQKAVVPGVQKGENKIF